MKIFTILWYFLKMFYQLLCCSFSFISFLFNVFWFMCNLASAGIPWFTVLLVVICVASKFVKLKSPNEKQLLRLLAAGSQGLYPEDLSFWPIAQRGAGYDAPENSKAALKKCITRGYRNVLVDAGLTACGKIVIVNRLTLEKAGLSGSIAVHTLETLKKINIAELHPMGKHFEAEYVLTLKELLDFLEDQRLTVFLYISDNSSQMLECLKTTIQENPLFIQRIILISRSPITIYQLRKLHPELICGLWTEKSLALPLLKASTLITSIYGAFFRNIISPVIGISVVFVSKEEFNFRLFSTTLLLSLWSIIISSNEALFCSAHFKQILNADIYNTKMLQVSSSKLSDVASTECVMKNIPMLQESRCASIKHIAELWRNVGVRPIVYNVNSPNEKRYFQKTMKTQYLTDSLRSEPHLLMKA